MFFGLFLALQAACVLATSYKAATYYGCYSYSALKDFDSQGSYTYQSEGYCTELCSNGSYALAAMYNGDECLCGSILPSSDVDDSNCDTDCAGYPSDTCGGSSAVSLYYTHEGTLVSGSDSASESSSKSSSSSKKTSSSTTSSSTSSSRDTTSSRSTKASTSSTSSSTSTPSTRSSTSARSSSSSTVTRSTRTTRTTSSSSSFTTTPAPTSTSPESTSIPSTFITTEQEEDSHAAVLYTSVATSESINAAGSTIQITYTFTSTTTATSTSNPTAATALSKQSIIGISAGCAVAAISIAIILFLLYKKRQMQKAHEDNFVINGKGEKCYPNGIIIPYDDKENNNYGLFGKSTAASVLNFDSKKQQQPPRTRTFGLDDDISLRSSSTTSLKAVNNNYNTRNKDLPPTPISNLNQNQNQNLNFIDESDDEELNYEGYNYGYSGNKTLTVRNPDDDDDRSTIAARSLNNNREIEDDSFEFEFEKAHLHNPSSHQSLNSNSAADNLMPHAYQFSVDGDMDLSRPISYHSVFNIDNRSLSNTSNNYFSRNSASIIDTGRYSVSIKANSPMTDTFGAQPYIPNDNVRDSSIREEDERNINANSRSRNDNDNENGGHVRVLT